METEHVTSISDEQDRLIGRADAERIVAAAKRDVSSEGLLQIDMYSWWSGSVRWARNRPFLTRNGRNTTVQISRRLGPKSGSVNVSNISNQVHDDAIRYAMQYVEYFLERRGRGQPGEYTVPLASVWAGNAGGDVWSEATYNPDLPYERKVLAALIDRSENENLLAAGYLESFAATGFRFTRDYAGRESLVDCGRFTQAQMSMTARSGDSMASGWAGQSSHGLDRIPLEKIGTVALEKCLSSRAPVRLEPGRYTTILEPQAAHTLLAPLVRAMGRIQPEGGQGGPFQLEYDPTLNRVRTKLGLKVLDERLNIFHDPEDPNTATMRTPGAERVQWVKNGVLVGLSNPGEHESHEMYDEHVHLERTSFSVEGTSTSLDELIASTHRGLIVTRFSDTSVLDTGSLLISGFTRDGLWLIENGKITRAVKNFRFTESPLFAFNNIEQIGVAQPVWSPSGRSDAIISPLFRMLTLSSCMIPSIKVKDFSFTTTIDAI